MYYEELETEIKKMHFLVTTNEIIDDLDTPMIITCNCRDLLFWLLELLKSMGRTLFRSRK